MKRNLKEEIEKIIYQPGVGAVWLHDETMKQLLTLISDTINEIIGEDEKFDKETEDWRVAIRTQKNNLRFEQRARKKDLGL